MGGTFPGAPKLCQSNFGWLPTGEPVTEFTMKNECGMRVFIINYGCRITKIMVPDQHGQTRDVVLGFDRLEDYLGALHFGGIIGRYANWIGGGEIIIDGQTHTLSVNENQNTLHGGNKGFDTRLWTMTTFSDDCPEVMILTLTYISPDKEEGFSGTLKCCVDYILWKKENKLKIRYRATTDKPTVVNLTQHPYFNLEGHMAGSIVDHEFQIFMDSYLLYKDDKIPTGEIVPVEGTPFDFTSKVKRVGQDIDNLALKVGAKQMIPTGDIIPVEGTPFDFKTKAKRVGQDIDNLALKVGAGHGYDHCYFAPTKPRGELRLCSRHLGPKSGIVMEVETTQPGLVFYSGNWLHKTIRKGKDGAKYGHRSGFALLTQNLPDVMHHTNSPNCILRPDETYDEVTVFKFSTRSPW